MDVSAKTVTVIGLAKSGRAAAELLRFKHARVRISEQQPDSAMDPEIRKWISANGFECEWGHREDFIRQSDLLIVSPGVRIGSRPLQWARKHHIPVWSEVELAYRFCPCPIIAVTGSNGKTTVSTLIHQILSRAGYSSVLCGNIGTPFSAQVQNLEPTNWVVLEISSFQLETVDRFKPHIAVFLNFSANHLDRHRDLEEYFSAKKRIFMNQDAGDHGVLNADDGRLKALAAELRAQVHFFNAEASDEIDMDPNPNFRAAYRVARLLGISKEIIQELWDGFQGVEHRLEKVRVLEEVVFVNDSKATTAEAGRWALERIPQPVIMICGGRDKNIDFSFLRNLVAQKVRKMIVIGEASLKLKTVFEKFVDVQSAPDLASAVSQAYRSAQKGDCVLLSPMCASFDMFQNFEERGRVFKQLVKNLKMRDRSYS